MGFNARTQGALVLIASFIGVFMTTPGQTVGVSSFVDYLATDLGLPRERVLALYSLGTLLGILPAPLIGRVVDRYGPHRVIPFVAVAVGSACVALACVSGPWSLAIGFTLLRGAAIGGLSLVSMHLVNLWFDRLRGSATAIAMLGLAMGGLVLPWASEQVSIVHGWRASYLALGALVTMTMLPVGLLLFRDRPQRYGLLPDFGRAHSSSKDTRQFQIRTGEDLGLSEARRTTIFWFLVSIAILANAIGTALMLDHVRALQVAGIGRPEAIGLLGVVTIAQGVSVIVGGILVDRYGTRRIGLLGLAILALAVASMLTTSAPVRGLIYALTLGSSLGILHVVQGAGLAEHFGTQHLGRLRGTTFVCGIFGAAAGPLAFAYGSPEIGYAIFLGLSLAAIGLGLSSATKR